MLLKQLLRIISFKELTPLHWMFIFAAFFVLHLPAIRHAQGIVNDYEVLARSFIKGELWFSENDLPFVEGTQVRNTGDVAFYQGKYYLPYPPAPALLLVPLALAGQGAINCMLIAVLFGCLNIFLLYSIFKKSGIDPEYFPWLIYGFIFGTGYWFVLLVAHHVYGFAEVVSVTSILLLLNELFGKKRALLMGIFLGIAFLSRQFTIFIGLFVLAYLVYQYMRIPNRKDPKLFWKKSVAFSVSVGCCVFIYFLYNYTRFGNPLDTGYSHINFIGILKERVDQYGVFSGHYVLYNLYSYLFKGFNIEFTGKGLLQISDVDLFGTALLMGSPFLVAAFKTGWNKLLRISAWLTIAIIFTGLLFYHNNGKDQVNACRFTLDFLPLLMLLAGFGVKNVPPWLFKGMVSYAIVLNVIAIGIHFFYHSR